MRDRREYYKQNRRRCIEYSRLWRENHPEYNREFAEKHQAKRLENSKRFYEKIKLSERWKLHWKAAKYRCNNPNSTYYHCYGGRGIKFKLTLTEVKRIWFRDKAYDLKEPSIDRINNDGDYTVNNIRFIERRKNKNYKWRTRNQYSEVNNVKPR